ncbi:MAG: flagellar basal body rod protein FlgC [Pusillimonas sp.]|nr:flagellar basal body rod protein FlgC [Pusillimonas sp.]
MAPVPGQAHAGAVGGVQVSNVVESNAPARMEYQPDHPLANEEGYVEMPNVDVVAETVNMISASRSYQANVEVVNTAKALMSRTLSIGQ